jgi:hypothetical protein
MNGIVFLKKHVDVEHFFIAKKIEEAIKVFPQMYQMFIIHTRIIYYNKIIYVILYEYHYLINIINYYYL